MSTRTILRYVGFAGLAFSISCGPTQKGFAKKMAKALCKYSEECQASYFNEYYDDVGECVDEYEDYYDADDYEDCEYDRKKAKSCLKSVKTATKSCDYDDFEWDDCADVYDCSDGSGGGGGDSG